MSEQNNKVGKSFGRRLQVIHEEAISVDDLKFQNFEVIRELQWHCYSLSGCYEGGIEKDSDQVLLILDGAKYEFTVHQGGALETWPGC
ncbi:hypothetical protein ALO67_200018 [Pseudomonas amygdali pv. hibisci]|uniref:ABC transporter ATP-binding protein n=1 Tax=Pseudomonas amygdali pv. hibisci TaxID=251723 RepID=A0AB34U7Q0_PSEA0|nr:hypothetical protein ALO67_200018 [Pseudomonas amygdali pv. hibisci]